MMRCFLPTLIFLLPNIFLYHFIHLRNIIRACLVYSKYPSGVRKEKNKKTVAGCVSEANFHWPVKYHHSIAQFTSMIAIERSFRSRLSDPVRINFFGRKKHYINYPIYSFDLRELFREGSRTKFINHSEAIDIFLNCIQPACR